jgi:tRNA 2-thiouridine synthesizing protein A
MATTQKADSVLDVRGALCPIPIVKTSQAIKQLKVGDTLEVLATDPGSRPDITAWVRMTGNELVDMTEQQGSPKVYRFQIRRLK